MDTFTINTENVNVEEIMKEIHRRVLEKKQAGLYTDEELKKLTELKADLSPKKNERYGVMNLHLRKLHSNWDVAASGGMITSHRKVLGPFIILAKRIGFKFIRFFGSAFFVRQTEYNASNVRFNSVVLEELTRLTEENRQLQQKQQELLRHIELLQTQSSKQ
jgi:hypothetical protein